MLTDEFIISYNVQLEPNVGFYLIILIFNQVIRHTCFSHNSAIFASSLFIHIRIKRLLENKIKVHEKLGYIVVLGLFARLIWPWWYGNHTKVVVREPHKSGGTGTTQKWWSGNHTKVVVQEPHKSGGPGTTQKWWYGNHTKVVVREPHKSGGTGTTQKWWSGNHTKVVVREPHKSGGPGTTQKWWYGNHTKVVVREPLKTSTNISKQSFKVTPPPLT